MRQDYPLAHLRRRTATCLPSFLLAAALSAPALSAPALSARPPTRFETLSVEDGLASNGVWTVFQDSRGFLWLGGDEGLSRYDGYHVRVFRHDPQEPSSITASTVIRIYEDRRGELWLATPAGLNRFRRDDETFVHFRHDPDDPASLASDFVLRIAEDAGGKLWVGTRFGVDRFDRTTGGFAHHRHDPDDPGTLSDDHVTAIFTDSAGRLWIGTAGGLDRLDPANGRAERHGDAVPHRVNAVAERPDGRLWLGTTGGLLVFDPERGTAETTPLAEPVRTLRVDSGGTLWIGTVLDGLVLLDPNGSLTHVRNDPDDPESLASDNVYAIFEDRSGLVWVGTVDGVSRYDPRREAFTAVRRRPGGGGLSEDRVWAVLEDRHGELWVGTYSLGLDRLDQDGRVASRYRHDSEDPSSLPNNAVSALFEDRDGELWVGTLNGLARFDRRRERFARMPLPGDTRVLSFAEDDAGRLWIATGRGLAVLDREADRVRLLERDGVELPRGIVRDVVAHGDELWIASDDGLWRLDPDAPRVERFRHHAEDPASLPSDAVNVLSHDGSGLWIGTTGGLARLDPEARAVRRYAGLPSRNVTGILPAAAGEVWVSTTRGLARLTPDAVDVYDRGDGLTTEVFSASSAFVGRHGLYFGSTRGLQIVDPKKFREDPLPPAVVITAFHLFGQEVRPGDDGSPLERSILETDEVVLSHRDYVFSFEIAALAFASPKSNRYAHRLEEFDPEWIHSGADQRTAHYANLKPGRYVFRAKASNDDGVWNEEGVSIAVVVRPPPWRTWWAWTCYAVTLGALVWAWVGAQRRKLEDERAVSRHLRQADRVKDELMVRMEGLITELEAKNTELERYTYTVSHDLKAPLVTIKGFLGYVRQDVQKGDVERLEHDIGHITTAANQMQRLLDELLELSRIGRVLRPTERVSLSELAREAAEIVRGKALDRDAEIVVSSVLPVVEGDRLRLFEVFQNLLENAVKFAGDTPRIEIGLRDGGVVFVADNGPGIDPRYHDKVFGLFERLDPGTEGTGIGLALVKRIVELHGGRIWIESDGEGRGTTFCFTIEGAPK